MVTKINTSMNELHTHTYIISKNTRKNEITRGDFTLKYID